MGIEDESSTEPDPNLRPDPRDALQLDPDAPPAKPNAERSAPKHPLKDQGDPLDGS